MRPGTALTTRAPLAKLLSGLTGRILRTVRQAPKRRRATIDAQRRRPRATHAPQRRTCSGDRYARGQQARAAGIAQSTGSKGDCFDNALTESFFATVKKELIHRCSWPIRAELRTEVFDYIEVFYNRERRHSTLGQRSPVDYENRTLRPSGSIDAASRLPSLDQINIMSATTKQAV